MIPITLITGFLGSGKTTLLEEIYQKNRQRKLIYLINDFSVHDVDATFFSTDDRTIISVPGGSIFCTCLVTEFVKKLNEILTMAGKAADPFDGLVIEASGIANPSVIKTLLKESGMDRHFRLVSIISVADPVSFPKLQQTLPNIIQQIQSADHIILNKTDLVDSKVIDDVTEHLKKINSKSQIHVSQYCHIDFNPLDTTDYRRDQLTTDSAHKPDPAFAKFSIQKNRPLILDQLKQLVDKNPKSFYRIKGFILDEEEDTMYLDYSISTGLKLSSVKSKIRPHLEFIFKGTDSEMITEQLRLFSRDGFK
jgi:G3E family GTPase